MQVTPKSKKFLAMLMALTMLLSVFPGGLPTASAATLEEGKLYVAGVDITTTGNVVNASTANITGTISSGSATLTYEGGKPILTLDNFQYEGQGSSQLFAGGYDTIYFAEDAPELTIVLVGENRIEQTDVTGDYVSSIGILLRSPTTIQGTGSLYVSGGSNTASSFSYSAGILVLQSSLTIASGSIEAIGKDAKTDSVGIWGKLATLTISSDVSNVTAASGSADESSALMGNVVNAIPGKGWTNAAETEGEAEIAISMEERWMDGYKKVVFSTASAATLEEGKLYVAGVDITTTGNVVDANTANITGTISSGSATLTYDGENPILTLENFQYEGQGSSQVFGHYYDAIYFADDTPDLTIVLEGENRIVQTDVDVTEDTSSAGILLKGPTTIQGTGSLYVSGGSSSSDTRVMLFANQLRVSKLQDLDVLHKILGNVNGITKDFLSQVKNTACSSINFEIMVILTKIFAFLCSKSQYSSVAIEKANFMWYASKCK